MPELQARVPTRNQGLFSQFFICSGQLAPVFTSLLTFYWFRRGASTLRLVEIRRARGHHCFECYLFVFITLSFML